MLPPTGTPSPASWYHLEFSRLAQLRPRFLVVRESNHRDIRQICRLQPGSSEVALGSSNLPGPDKSHLRRKRRELQIWDRARFLPQLWFRMWHLRTFNCRSFELRFGESSRPLGAEIEAARRYAVKGPSPVPLRFLPPGICVLGICVGICVGIRRRHMRPWHMRPDRARQTMASSAVSQAKSSSRFIATWDKFAPLKITTQMNRFYCDLIPGRARFGQAPINVPEVVISWRATCFAIAAESPMGRRPIFARPHPSAASFARNVIGSSPCLPTLSWSKEN